MLYIHSHCGWSFLFIVCISLSLSLSPFVSLGLDPKVLSSVINQASGRCWSSDTYNPCPGVIETVPSSNNYQGGFKTGLMAKVCTQYYTQKIIHIIL